MKQTFSDLVTLANDIIFSNKSHKDYTRVVKYAKLMQQLITGEAISELLQRFTPREDPELFKQRVNLSQLTTPAICNTIMTPAFKIPRVKPMVDEIKYGSDEQATSIENKKKLEEAMKRFNGQDSETEYLSKILLPLVYVDPNSWVFTLHKEEDGVTIPYPTVATSTDAFNFEFINGVLQWIMIKRAIVFQTMKGTSPGEWFCLYGIDNTLEYTQVDPKVEKISDGLKIGVLYTVQDVPGSEGIQTIAIDSEAMQMNESDNNKVFYIRIDKKRVFRINWYQTNTGEVPAFRTGVVSDFVTDGRTMLSPIQPAMAYLMKSVMYVSELDISMKLHNFPQKYAYVGKCKAEGCMGGHDMNGTKCATCGGSGLDLHKTAADTVTFPLPKDPTEIIDLTKMVFYAGVPTDSIKYQDEYVTKLEEKSIRAVYNSDTFTRNQVMKTALESGISLQSVYDALFPIGGIWSLAIIKQRRLSAKYLGIDRGLQLTHRFGSDWKFRGLTDLLEDLKSARDSGSSEYILSEIMNDIVELIYQDRPEDLKKLRVKQKFNPFEGKSEAIVLNLLSSQYVPKSVKVLYAMFKIVFSDLEREQSESATNFYSLTEKAQSDLIIKKVEDILKQIEIDYPVAQPFNAFN